MQSARPEIATPAPLGSSYDLRNLGTLSVREDSTDGAGSSVINLVSSPWGATR